MKIFGFVEFHMYTIIMYAGPCCAFVEDKAPSDFLANTHTVACYVSILFVLPMEMIQFARKLRDFMGWFTRCCFSSKTHQITPRILSTRAGSLAAGAQLVEEYISNMELYPQQQVG